MKRPSRPPSLDAIPTQSRDGQITERQRVHSDAALTCGSAKVFFFRLIVAFAGFMLLWLPWGEHYRGLLISAGNTIFGRVCFVGDVRFLAYDDLENAPAIPRVDVAVLVPQSSPNLPNGKRAWILAKAFSTLYQPYSAVAFLLGLFLATRIPWWERLWKLAIAVPVLHLLMFGVIWVDIFHALTVRGNRVGAMPDWIWTGLGFLRASITDWPAGAFIVPLVLWLLFFWPGRSIRSLHSVG